MVTLDKIRLTGLLRKALETGLFLLWRFAGNSSWSRSGSLRRSLRNRAARAPGFVPASLRPAAKTLPPEPVERRLPRATRAGRRHSALHRRQHGRVRTPPSLEVRVATGLSRALRGLRGRFQHRQVAMPSGERHRAQRLVCGRCEGRGSVVDRGVVTIRMRDHERRAGLVLGRRKGLGGGSRRRCPARGKSPLAGHR